MEDRSMLKEFKEFAMRGNVVDMAVGIILGAAFGTIVKSMVNDLLMPLIGLLIQGVNFSDIFFVLKAGDPAGPYATVEAAREAGAVTVNLGLFINAVISFTLVAFAVFLVVRGMNHMRRKEEAPAEPTTKDCPQCLSKIPIKAKRCAHCTTQIEAA
jgi:large conductance mechanosensitive channel